MSSICLGFFGASVLEKDQEDTVGGKKFFIYKVLFIYDIEKSLT